MPQFVIPGSAGRELGWHGHVPGGRSALSELFLPAAYATQQAPQRRPGGTDPLSRPHR
ncbi:hypothetical protein [Nocardiopsis sp. NPDC058789]|uniref:hypothetical protein n=1 Tax=Nocardiopsis sp. NPDC058789 TaxID=3346634 RepID=UPI003672F110